MTAVALEYTTYASKYAFDLDSLAGYTGTRRYLFYLPCFVFRDSYLYGIRIAANGDRVRYSHTGCPHNSLHTCTPLGLPRWNLNLLAFPHKDVSKLNRNRKSLIEIISFSRVFRRSV